MCIANARFLCTLLVAVLGVDVIAAPDLPRRVQSLPVAIADLASAIA
jgi:hypothetical protein